MIKFLDKFSHNLPKKNVVVIAEASIHNRDSILNKLEKWKFKKVEIFGLPTYSQKPNIIEILWTFIKVWMVRDTGRLEKLTSISQKSAIAIRP